MREQGQFNITSLDECIIHKLKRNNYFEITAIYINKRSNNYGIDRRYKVYTRLSNGNYEIVLAKLDRAKNKYKVLQSIKLEHKLSLNQYIKDISKSRKVIDESKLVQPHMHEHTYSNINKQYLFKQLTLIGLACGLFETDCKAYKEEIESINKEIQSLEDRIAELEALRNKIKQEFSRCEKENKHKVKPTVNDKSF